jgi:hypothetical protein
MEVPNQLLALSGAQPRVVLPNIYSELFDELGMLG